MTTQSSTYVQADLATTPDARVLGSVVREGVAGWTRVLFPSGEVWVYPPMHHALLTGLIAQQEA